MLRKESRLDRRSVGEIFKSGLTVPGGCLIFKFIISPGGAPARVSFIVPKTVSPKAVDRNSLRRLGYRALENRIKNLPSGVKAVFIFKKRASFLEIEEAIEKILKKL